MNRRHPRVRVGKWRRAMLREKNFAKIVFAVAEFGESYEKQGWIRFDRGGDRRGASSGCA